ncbi:MAG: 5-formyltetrahydrofolate cyclo-ligase [Proteobacteria bacterium]|nr:5-formyltetrahydrofolate cyclo-ligase [Pseudomonadota bacterium]MBU1639427.1 5-formyltetrahydrofolate cyclo-ligase [Pseudomonadota bacterium]
MANDKNSIRQQIQDAPYPSLNPGLIAECLRKQDIYRQSSLLFVSPTPQLNQIRINALIDGKTLLVPGPAIKKGFYLLKPYAISFKDLGHAVSLKGIESFGKLLSSAALTKLHVDLAITDCLAVAADGGRLGLGTGFFDLAMAILSDLGAVNTETRFGAVGVDEQLLSADLPQESWDVRLHFFLASSGFTLFPQDAQKVQVFWDVLEKKRIRKIEPLWHLYQAQFPEIPGT